ncbi:MAG: MaoC family dehydratase N-terminal domain-containing protein [Candidatus Lokiarchaeota archaeon]|nr:MaoC family dehydratase N-terminal domain-containing protein [Candidatus Lokiarchaeota archaeon]
MSSIEEMKNNAKFLIETLPGKEVPGSVRINVRYKNLVNFAKCFGITDPKYIGPEEEGIIACHAYANAYTIKGLYSLVPGAKIVKDGEERMLVKNPRLFLHTGNIYNWEGCVDVKPGDKLTVTAKWGKLWLVEANMMLFAELITTIKNQNNELVCNVVVTAGIRKGGY